MPPCHRGEPSQPPSSEPVPLPGDDCAQRGHEQDLFGLGGVAPAPLAAQRALLPSDAVEHLGRLAVEVKDLQALRLRIGSAACLVGKTPALATIVQRWREQLIGSKCPCTGNAITSQEGREIDLIL